MSAVNLFDLLSCTGGFLGGVPGITWTSTNTSASLDLLNTSSSSDGSITVFDCI